MRRLVLASVVLCAGSFGAAHAQEEGAVKPIAVAGLRPAAEGYKATDIIRLSQAQTLRQLVDEAVHEVTHRVVLNHGALRADLGQRYLVEFFDCEGDLRCVVRVFAKVRSKASHLVYGDYSIKRGTYRVRMRLVDLATGSLASEVEFTLSKKESEDAAVWRQKLKTLLAVVATAGETGGGETGGGETGGGETGGGETGGGETGGGETGGGETGGGETGGGETGGGGGATSSDELTDADFGAPVEEVAVQAQQTRDDLPWLVLATTAAMTSRYFDFETAEDNEVLRPAGYSSDWTAKVGGSLEIYPLAALVRRGFLRRVGLAGEYGRSDISEAGGRETSLYAGATFKIPVGTSASNPTFGMSGGFLRHDFVILDEMSTFPSVSYRGARVGLDVRVPLGSPRVALYGDMRYMFGVPKGALFQVERYGASRIGGYDLEGFLEIRPLTAVFIRVGGRYTRFSLEFDGDGDLSDLGSVGAQDRYLNATVSTGLVL